MKTGCRNPWADWARERLRPDVLRRDAERRFDRDAWQALGDTEFFASVAGPETGFGTAGLAAMTQALTALARGSLDLPFVLSVAAQAAAVRLVARHARPELAARVVPRLVAAQLTAAVCPLGGRLEHGRILMRRPLVTNAPAAQCVLVSGTAGTKPGIDFYCLEIKNETSEPGAAAEVSGLWTGCTGTMLLDVPLAAPAAQAARLGAAGYGEEIRREARDLERLFQPAAVAGMLAGMVDDAVELSRGSSVLGHAIAEITSVQDKVLGLWQASNAMSAGLAQVLATAPGSPELELRLASLRQQAGEAALDAAIAYYEVHAAVGYHDDSVAQKLVRDLLALRSVSAAQGPRTSDLFQALRQG